MRETACILRHRPPSVPARLLPAILIAGVLLLASTAPAIGAPSASTGAACWQRLLTDWYDGSIDAVYPLPCYHQAVEHIPATLQIYSSAKDDILNAQAAAASGRQPAPVKQPAPSGAGATATQPHGGSSVPLPLLVLGGLAILLLAAGTAGTLWRRTHPRRPGTP